MLHLRLYSLELFFADVRHCGTLEKVKLPQTGKKGRSVEPLGGTATFANTDRDDGERVTMVRHDDSRCFTKLLPKSTAVISREER